MGAVAGVAPIVSRQEPKQPSFALGNETLVVFKEYTVRLHWRVAQWFKKRFVRWTCSELRSCVKEEVDVLGSLVPNSPYGLCGT